MSLNILQPDWNVANIQAGFITRQGGVSIAPYDSLNLGEFVADSPSAVEHNRNLVEQWLQVPALYLKQVHGTACVDLDNIGCSKQEFEADAALTSRNDLACCVQVADCLPVLLVTTDGAVVAAAHAGWRGLVNGVLEQTVQAMQVKQASINSTASIIAWLGPCIGNTAFEVGTEVREQFLARDSSLASQACFIASSKAGHYLADLAKLAHLRLKPLVASSMGNDSSLSWCTHSNPNLYFSYRREQAKFGATGRMAAYIRKL